MDKLQHLKQWAASKRAVYREKLRKYWKETRSELEKRVRKVPPRYRKAARVGYTFLWAVGALVMSPVTLTLYPFLHWRVRMARDVEQQTRKLWDEQGADVAMAQLRKTYTNVLTAASAKKGPRAWFGIGNLADVTLLSAFVYLCEAQVKDWTRALAVADDMLRRLKRDEAWLLRRARCLMELARTDEAGKVLERCPRSARYAPEHEELKARLAQIIKDAQEAALLKAKSVERPANAK